MGIARNLLAAISASAFLAGGATAATMTSYSFDQTVPDSGPFSLSCDAGGLSNVGCTVSHSEHGYGVNGYGYIFGDTQPDQIDGFPGYEVLTVTFDHAVTLVDFTLGRFNESYRVCFIRCRTVHESDDSFDGSINGEGWYEGLSGNPFSVGEVVTSFSLRAGPNSTDDFTLASMTIAPVPLPAAAPMLLAALGGLAALRRRRRATA